MSNFNYWAGVKMLKMTRRTWFRDLDSNQDTQLQRLMSYQLDDPGKGPQKEV